MEVNCYAIILEILTFVTIFRERRAIVARAVGSGIHGLARVVSENIFYVDKTLFIKE